MLGELDIATFSEAAAAAVEWTRAAARRRRSSSCGRWRRRAAATGFGLFHASPRDPVWEYVLSLDQAEAGLDAQEERVGLIGHSHVALFFTRPAANRPTYAHGAQAGDGAARRPRQSGAWLLNPGSVGQPRDGDPRAAWLELDTEELDRPASTASSYDIDAAAAAILDAGLPSPLADRLQIGR